MAITALQVSILVERELTRITDSQTAVFIRSLLVPPHCENRPWDYGLPGTEYPCWIVIEHAPSGTAIAYCEEGFGPKKPWGLLWISGELSMGMDSSWYDSLEGAVKESHAWPQS
jgi:hypothetical protein